MNRRNDVAVESGAIDGALVDRHKLKRVADGAQLARIKVSVRPLEVDADELADERGTILGATFLDLHVHLLIFRRRAEAVDGGDRGDDDDILTSEEGLGRGVAEPVYLGIDHRFFLYISIRVCDVGL